MASGWEARAAALKSGRAWDGGSVTYSDPDRSLDYEFSYPVDAPLDGFAALSARQLAAARTALDVGGGGPAGRAGFAVEGFTRLGVGYAGAGSGGGDIRLANTRDAPTAYAFMPGDGPEAGDVWFGGSGGDPRTGNYDHMTVLHEVGHALGLDHAHAGGRNGAVPIAYDTIEYTVMSYRGWQGAPASGYRFGEWDAPQTYMVLDIAALQQLYGADFRVNAGDTVYTWSPGSGRTWVNGGVGLDPGGDTIFATVWDGGGRDCYDLTAYASDLRLDLRPGGHSVFDRGQLADLGGGPNGGHARGSVFNALQFRGDARSLIEDARAGSGDDRLVGNTAGNRLCGGGGDDRLEGLGGRDVLVGGRGADVFVFARVGVSPAGAGDRLVGDRKAAAFEAAGPDRGDRIDLRDIDADETRSGDQAFAFGAATGTGRLWVREEDGMTIVCGNVDRDGNPDFELLIRDHAVRCGAYAADDFLL